MAQLDQSDLDMITNHLAQELSSNDNDEQELAQTEVGDDGDMLTKVAQFMAQLSEEEIDSMETYLVQMENATEAGD